MELAFCWRRRSISSVRPWAQAAGCCVGQHDKEEDERGGASAMPDASVFLETLGASAPLWSLHGPPFSCRRSLRPKQGGSRSIATTGEPNGEQQEREGSVGGDGILGGQPGRGRRSGGDLVPLCPASARGAGSATLRHSPLARRAREVLLLRGLQR